MIREYWSTFPERLFFDLNRKLFLDDRYGSSKYTFNETDRSIILDATKEVYRPWFIHFPKLNQESSIPINRIFEPTKLFEVGKNYKTIGQKINGSEHINGFPAEMDVFAQSIWIERGVLIGICLLFIIGIAICIVHRK